MPIQVKPIAKRILTLAYRLHDVYDRHDTGRVNSIKATPIKPQNGHNAPESFNIIMDI